MSDTVKINVKGLDQLLKALKQTNPPKARVGILGTKAGPHYELMHAGQKPPKTIPTNAEVGATHEFGSPSRGIPQRSFLRIPISDNLTKYLKKTGALDKDALKQVIKQGSVIPWLKKVTAVAESIVMDAFDTGGFGEWPEWKNPSYHNNAGQLLVDTTQLRNSITSEVKE